jgi:hypothetical protein
MYDESVNRAISVDSRECWIVLKKVFGANDPRAELDGELGVAQTSVLWNFGLNVAQALAAQTEVCATLFPRFASFQPVSFVRSRESSQSALSIRPAPSRLNPRTTAIL